VDPDRESCQLDRDVVCVDAVDAPPCHLSAQETRCLDLDAVGELTERVERRAAQRFELCVDRPDRMKGEKPGQPRLDPVAAATRK